MPKRAEYHGVPLPKCWTALSMRDQQMWKLGVDMTLVHLTRKMKVK